MRRSAASSRTTQPQRVGLTVQHRLPRHAQLDVVGDLRLGPFGGASPRQCLGVLLGLQQTGNELGFIAADPRCALLQADEQGEPAPQRAHVIAFPPTLLSRVLGGLQIQRPPLLGHVVQREQHLVEITHDDRSLGGLVVGDLAHRAPQGLGHIFPPLIRTPYSGIEVAMIETPVRTDDSCHDEHPNDGTAGVVIQPHDCHDELDETPGEGIWPRTPLCDEAEFAELVDEMVADEAPRLFAVVQEYGKRVDGRIAAWGMAFDDRAEIISVDDGTSVSLSSPERAALGFNRRPNITARVVWVNPDAATAPDEIENGVADSDADTRS